MNIDGDRQLLTFWFCLHLLLLVSLEGLAVHGGSGSSRRRRNRGGGRRRGNHMKLTLFWESGSHHIFLEHTTLEGRKGGWRETSCNYKNTCDLPNTTTFNLHACGHLVGLMICQGTFLNYVEETSRAKIVGSGEKNSVKIAFIKLLEIRVLKGGDKSIARGETIQMPLSQDTLWQ